MRVHGGHGMPTTTVACLSRCQMSRSLALHHCWSILFMLGVHCRVQADAVLYNKYQRVVRTRAVRVLRPDSLGLTLRLALGEPPGSTPAKKRPAASLVAEDVHIHIEPYMHSIMLVYAYHAVVGVREVRSAVPGTLCWGW